VRIPQEVKDHADAVARERDITFSQLMRKAIRKELSVANKGN
jgi:antitoxin component of RelBE/YafQ-DinJ toxin-antitoxin module